jgi:hypothetical protein
MENTNTILTDSDVKKIGGTFVRHLVLTENGIEGDEYSTSDGGLYLVNVKLIDRNTQNTTT